MKSKSMHQDNDGPDATETEFRLRREMLNQVVAEAEEILRDCGEPALSPPVVQAMLRVPRARFVPSLAGSLAYENTPLSIGHGQTISQPLVVALMTHLLGVGPEDRVLEIGTGSGYQAAILGELVNQVYTVEVVPELGVIARERLKALGYDNVCVRVGDGGCGWPERTLFDGIIVTAATPKVPPGLLEELKPGGRLVIPLGDMLEVQWLSVVRKRIRGDTTVERIMPVRFVPLTGIAVRR